MWETLSRWESTLGRHFDSVLSRDAERRTGCSPNGSVIRKKHQRVVEKGDVTKVGHFSLAMFCNYKMNPPCKMNKKFLMLFYFEALRW